VKVLAIIPARGGSKGIKLKNIQKLAGHPLIIYTINSAKKSKLIDRIIVSTDDKKISRISKLNGAELPFTRPKTLSRDSSSTIDVVKHTLNFLKNKESYVPDIIIILQPTSPLRSYKKIDKSIQLLKKNNSDSVISVYRTKPHPFRSFWYQNNFLKPYNPDFEKFHQHQLQPELYSPTGEIYTFWNKTIQKYDSIFGKKIKPLFLTKNEYPLDIDSIFDLFVCEMTIKYWNSYHQHFLKS